MWFFKFLRGFFVFGTYIDYYWQKMLLNSHRIVYPISQNSFFMQNNRFIKILRHYRHSSAWVIDENKHDRKVFCCSIFLRLAFETRETFSLVTKLHKNHGYGVITSFLCCWSRSGSWAPGRLRFFFEKSMDLVKNISLAGTVDNFWIFIRSEGCDLS